MMKATFTSNGSISCVSCIWYSPTWKRCCFVHGFVVASRSSAIVRRLATALALSLAARCAASLCPCDALSCAASRPAARPAAPAASFIPPPPPSYSDITCLVTSRQYYLASSGIAGQISRHTWFFMCCSAT